MKRIYKYSVEVRDEQDIYLPVGAEILSVAEQYNRIVLYAIVDSEAETKPHHISVRGTGHELNDKEGRFIGTVKLYNGDLMFHVFCE